MVVVLTSGEPFLCYFNHSDGSTQHRSTGCTVHEMVTTHPPWGDLPPEAAMFKIGVGQTIPSLPDHISSSLKEFYHLCLIR